MNYLLFPFLVTPFFFAGVGGKALHCPACQRLGRVHFYGRHHCTACGSDFFFDLQGKPVPTLWQAALGPLVTWLVVCAAVMGLRFWMEGSFQHAWPAGAILIGFVLAYVHARRTKQFVTYEKVA
jgi:hypothetical protein